MQKEVADEVVDDHWEDDNTFTYNNVVDGSVPITISHGGGEMADLERGLWEDIHGKKKRRRRDTRNRWDILQRRVNGFRLQMEAMTDAYMKFTAGQRGSLEKATPLVPPELVENKYTVMVVDVFNTYTVDVPMVSTDVYISSCLVGQGFMPCSPWKPKLAITTHVLEMYRLTNLRCPALGIQAWMKALLDLQGAAFKPYSAQQFTTCFDLYLGILEEVDKRVKKALQRDSKDWRLKNCCPACTYKLEGEGQLYFSMLATCDGNNSLKRVLRKDKGFTEDGVPLRGGCKRPDPREASAGGDYFISQPEVDRWVKERLAEEVVLPTGIFIALCRHSFVLLVADMVRSGELAKYPLAIENTLMDAFGKDIGFGYDIGCGHAKTLKNSPLGPKAKEHNFRMLVGAFHGHAHNRRCQLKYLATYVEGMGIKDLEGCEHLFSKSNGLSRSVRYASVFHRKQTIRAYLAHVDTFDTYANLSTFLVNNYKQAVSILDTEKSVKYAMAQAGVTEEMMKTCLEEEKAYLDGLSVEPEEETDQMEYYKQLVNLQDRREKLKDIIAEGSTANGTVRRHARENLDRAVETVQATERRLSIEVRWIIEDPEWIQAAELVVKRHYRRVIDTLEGLVVKQILELTKVNQSGLAAEVLDPPGRLLTWAEVVNYTFLADFDLLRSPDTTSSIRAWATPAARQLLDSYHKLQRAREEIPKLNIEIRRFMTYMKDERAFLVDRESEIRAEDPVLAFFVRKYQNRRAMRKKLGAAFTGTLQPGIRVTPPVPLVPGREEQGPVPPTSPETTEMDIDEPTGGEEDEGSQDGWLLDDGSSDEDEGPDAEGEELSAVLEGAFFDVLWIL
ncbi:hypothetical protein K438DRAFT_1908475 [Mycena galopus ATCC 62051]|nr:hypothetical protein K438DRAFT_1908475 [Mycena galopus ATCC 62051]